MLGIILAVLSTLTYGSSGVLARLGLQYFKPLNGTILSLYASVAISLLVTIIFELQALLSISLSAFLWFSFVGLAHFAGGRFFSYLGVGYIGASRAAALRASSPFFSIVLAIIFLKEALTLPVLVGTLMVVVGSYFLVTAD